MYVHEKVMGTYDGVVYPHGRFTGIIGTYLRILISNWLLTPKLSKRYTQSVQHVCVCVCVLVHKKIITYVVLYNVM